MNSRIAAVSLVLASLVPAAAAAAGPSGTISCSVRSSLSTSQPTGLVFLPSLTGTPQLVRFVATNDGGSSCDNSGTTGGKTPITAVTFTFTARMTEGTCGALTSSAPQLENAKLTLKWRGVNAAGKLITVGANHTRIVSASYDLGAHTLTLTTRLLAGNSFRGKTVTLTLGISGGGGPNGDDLLAFFEAGCPGSGGFGAMVFGGDNPSTLVVQ